MKRHQRDNTQHPHPKLNTQRGSNHHTNKNHREGNEATFITGNKSNQPKENEEAKMHELNRQEQKREQGRREELNPHLLVFSFDSFH